MNRSLHNHRNHSGNMRAIFVDVDGTLTNGKSAWERVHHHFGVVKEMKKNTELFFSGKITYDEWAAIDVKLWKGKPYSELVKSLEKLDLVDNAKDGITLLKSAGFEVILISGGIDVFAMNVANAVGADLAISNRINQTDGIINGTVRINVSFSKAEVVKQITMKRGYDLKRSGAIGDHTNDIDMFSLVGYSLALNSKHEDVIKASTDYINTKDFLKVSKYFLSRVNN